MTQILHFLMLIITISVISFLLIICTVYIAADICIMISCYYHLCVYGSMPRRVITGKGHNDQLVYYRIYALDFVLITCCIQSNLLMMALLLLFSPYKLKFYLSYGYSQPHFLNWNIIA